MKEHLEERQGQAAWAATGAVTCQCKSEYAQFLAQANAKVYPGVDIAVSEANKVCNYYTLRRDGLKSLTCPKAGRQSQLEARTFPESEIHLSEMVHHLLKIVHRNGNSRMRIAG